MMVRVGSLETRHLNEDVEDVRGRLFQAEGRANTNPLVEMVWGVECHADTILITIVSRIQLLLKVI